MNDHRSRIDQSRLAEIGEPAGVTIVKNAENIERFSHVFSPLRVEAALRRDLVRQPTDKLAATSQLNCLFAN